MPVFDGRVGTAYLGLSEGRLRGIVNGVTGQLLLITLMASLVAVAAAGLLTWVLTRPILDLVDTTEAVSKGDLAARAPHWADDEIGTLADAFNRMVADLESGQQAIAEKEAARSRLLEQLITAQEERKRIARELHDGVGQSLSSLVWNLKTLSETEDAATVQRLAEELRVGVTDVVQQVRLISRELRPKRLPTVGPSLTAAQLPASTKFVPCATTTSPRPLRPQSRRSSTRRMLKRSRRSSSSSRWTSQSTSTS